MKLVLFLTSSGVSKISHAAFRGFRESSGSTPALREQQPRSSVLLPQVPPHNSTQPKLRDRCYKNSCFTSLWLKEVTIMSTPSVSVALWSHPLQSIALSGLGAVPGCTWAIVRACAQQQAPALTREVWRTKSVDATLGWHPPVLF